MKLYCYYYDFFRFEKTYKTGEFFVKKINLESENIEFITRNEDGIIEEFNANMLIYRGIITCFKPLTTNQINKIDRYVENKFGKLKGCI